MDDVIVIIISFAATSAVWLGILKLFGKGYLEKLNRDWKTKQEKDIVELKSSFQIFQSSTDVVQKRRIEAVEELWRSVMELRDLVDPLLSYETYSKSESSTPLQKQALQDWFNEISEFEPFSKEVQKLIKHDLKLRPFLTNGAWKYYHVYRGFIFRIMTEAIVAKQKSEKIPNWKEEADIRSLLKLVFTDEELDIVYKSDFESYNFIFVYLEESLLIEINRILSGESNIRDQKELFNKLRDENSPKLTLSDLIDRHEFKLLIKGFRGGI
jgi:hypothetical protein